MSEQSRVNHHGLKTLEVSIKYESPEMISSLDLPRKYTWVGHHISISHEYDQKLIQRAAEDTHVIGEWVKAHNKEKYEIHLEVIISSDKYTNVEARNKYFHQKLGLILEELAFAETSLLRTNSVLAGTKIRIKFKSADEKYARTEYWHRLGHWAAESMRAASEISERAPEKKKRSKAKHSNEKQPNEKQPSEKQPSEKHHSHHRHHQQQQPRAPQQCQMCKR